MAAPVLQFKRGNAGVAGTVPALRPGEPAISLNNFDFFIGIDTSVANNKFFGSHRYWGREDGTTSLRLKFVDKDGTNSINIKAPNTLSGVGTYTLPDTSTIQNGYFLKVATDGTLSWDTAGGTNGTFTNPTFTGLTTVTGTFDNDANSDFSGITTFSNTTDNTLGNANTGAVQIDGGVGIDKNLTVGGNLNVQGYSEFVGVVTFKSGTINLGDDTGDNINVGGEFTSGLYPNTTNTYDLGDGTRQWRHASFAGVGTFSTGVVADGVQIGINGANVIDTVSGNLTLNSAGGQTIIDDLVTIQNNLTVNGNITVGGTTVSLRGTDVFIENKDIILGYTTSVTPNDDTANHAGVAIASTVGSPLANFDASGINTLPSTYKQLMWFKSGTLGFSTDAFAFNYGVAIGTTTMANGLRFKVGSGITMTDTAISATTVNATTGNFTNLSGTLTGTISTATRANTVDTTTAPTGTFYPGLFVNSTGTASTAVYVDAGISYVSNTDTLTLTGDIAVNGGDVTTSATTFNLINGTATNVNFGGAATALVMGAATGIATINNPTLTLPNATTVNVNGANPTIAGSSTGTLTLFNTNLTTVNAFGAATGLVVGADSDAGITTIRSGTLVGTRATQNLYNTTATTVNAFGAGTALVIGATSGIATIRNTTFSLPNATTVNVNGANPTIAGSSTGTLTLFNANLTGVNAFGAATALVMGAATGIATINNATLTLPNATTVNVNGANPTIAGSSTGTLTLFNANLTRVNAFQAATDIVMGAVTGVTTVRNKLIVGGDLEIDGNDILASDGNTNITLTSNTLTTFAGDIRVNGNDIQASDGNTNITMTSNTLTEVKGDLQVTGNDIKSSTGANALTLSGSDVTVNGNLYVNGSTTQVNTGAITVEDRTIELGRVDGNVPASATTWDLGVLFNYNSSGSKKSAVIWEHGDSRFKFASVLGSDTDGTDVNTPQLTVTTFAPIEISALWVNDCAGQSQVISCTGTTRNLENITIDAGTF